MPRNVMLDIETLGTAPGCVVVSIGAVEFDRTTIGPGFHGHINIEDAVDNGLTICPRTLKWWMGQSDAARNSTFCNEEEGTLHAVLEKFTNAFIWQDTQVWANGASFDFPILKAAFSAVGLTSPWAYYNEMDYRPLKNIVPREVYKAFKIEPAIAHSAIEDAVAQALTTQSILNYLASPTRTYHVAAA